MNQIKENLLNNSRKYSVEVIIPVRARSGYDLKRRLEWRATYYRPANFKFTVVDYGSEGEGQYEIENACKNANIDYIHRSCANGVWNASRARNIALKNSEADYVFFEDVDLISHKNFYRQINRQIESLIINGGWEFFVVPVSYLSENYSNGIQSALTDEEYDEITSEIFSSAKEKIIFHAQASSYLLTSRKFAIRSGGYDESFEGWGFEDSDFWLRLLTKSRLEKPREFFKLDTREYSKQSQWSGWRSLYRIYADIIALKGIYAFHVWHKIADHRSEKIKERNRSIFNENTKFYQNDKLQIPPLFNELRPAQLFLSRNPHSFNEAIFEFFENPILIEESNIEVASIDQIINSYRINAAVFNNPYDNEKRLLIYNELRARGIKCYVVERGALPWSIYIDEGGFCAESPSYQLQNWGHLNPTETELKEVREYISDLRTSGASLEPQPSMIGGSGLRRRLFGETAGLRILFAAFQSPSDTTTTYFCGPVGSYENFLCEIERIPALLPSNWKLVYKNHPLAIEKKTIPGALMTITSAMHSRCATPYHS